MSLGLWGRFLVLLSGGLVVIVAVIIVACFVGPGCWGFEYLQREEKKKKQLSVQLPLKLKPPKKPKIKSGYYWMDGKEYVIHETLPCGFEAKVTKVNETPVHHSKENVFNLKCAPLLVAPNLYTAEIISTPKLEIKLFFSSLGNEDLSGRLTVQIISATFLPSREYAATLDPFVKLEILNNRWSLQKNERIVHTIQTRVVRNSTHPTFDETFVFEVKQYELRNWCLKFVIYDEDRLTGTTPLYERRLYLKEVKNLNTHNQVPFNFEMQEVTQNLGALFFGISYLPTAQRLNITIIKASKLKYQNSVQSLVNFYPYVRVVMVNNHGKFIKKKRTCFKHADDSPVFNHSLVFDLSISNLEQTVFLVLLCIKAFSNLSGSDDNSSIDGDIETSLGESKDKVLGKIVLGRNVRCTRARDHWVKVMQNPRKMISVWHDLK